MILAAVRLKEKKKHQTISMMGQCYFTISTGIKACKVTPDEPATMAKLVIVLLKSTTIITSHFWNTSGLPITQISMGIIKKPGYRTETF
jgi:hypothetical protein